MRARTAVLITLLGGCDTVASALLGKDIDTSVCTLSVEVPVESCGCAEGVVWSATDEVGDAFTSEDPTGQPGLQAVGETQTRSIGPGAFSLTATWHYLSGETSDAEGTGDCQGGGIATYHLACNCEDTLPGDTASAGA